MSCEYYKKYGKCKFYGKCKNASGHRGCSDFMFNICVLGEKCPFFHDFQEKKLINSDFVYSSEKEIISNEKNEKKFNIKKGFCCICLTKQSNMVAIPCGHLNYCDMCTKNKNFTNCSLCRTEIKNFQRVFCDYF